jgi:hypothetical protein
VKLQLHNNEDIFGTAFWSEACAPLSSDTPQKYIAPVDTENRRAPRERTPWI